MKSRKVELGCERMTGFMWFCAHPWQTAALAMMVLTVVGAATFGAAPFWALPLLFPGIAVGLGAVQRMLQPPQPDHNGRSRAD